MISKPSKYLEVYVFDFSFYPQEFDNGEPSDPKKRVSQSSSDLTSEICRHFPELSDEIRYATVPRSQKGEDVTPQTPPPSPEKKVEATTPEEEFETEQRPSAVNGEDNAAEPDEDNEKSPVFESDGAASTDRTVPVTTRLNRRRAGSLRSIRKRLSVQRRSTIGLGDNRNFSDDSEELQNEVMILNSSKLFF